MTRRRTSPFRVSRSRSSRVPPMARVVHILPKGLSLVACSLPNRVSLALSGADCSGFVVTIKQGLPRRIQQFANGRTSPLELLLLLDDAGRNIL